jgi:anti-sigma B factor antagonist
MALQTRIDGDLVILSNFAQLMNDPRHFDATRDVQELLDQGHRKFVIDLRGVRELGSSALGLVTTLTRRIRQQGGEAVLANLTPTMNRQIDAFGLDIFWEVFESFEEARAFFETAES